MPTRKSVPELTAARVKSLPAREHRYVVGDGTGLHVRVAPNGRKTFRYQIRSLDRVITLGPWTEHPTPGFLTLAEARIWLARLKGAHKAGKLPELEAALTALMRPMPAPIVDPATLTVRKVVQEFEKYLERERRRPEQPRATFKNDVLPTIGDMPIASVTSRDCRRVVEGVVARGSPVQAGHVLALLKQLFTFAIDRDEITSNPAARFRNPRALGVQKNVSQRFLSPDEITAFWRALDAYKGMTPTVRCALKLLLLLGVRSGELLEASWGEIDFQAATWTIPVAHQKMTRRREQTARPWVVPLPPTAIAILRDLEGLAKSVGSDRVLASFHPAAEGAAVTEKSLNHAMRRLFTSSPPILSFTGERPTPHDLRRTLRTHLGDKLRVPWHISERCLNHSLGGMTAVYDIADYLDERRDALVEWDAYVARLVSAEPAKVIPLASEASR